jgi:hypothetical protein
VSVVASYRGCASGSGAVLCPLKEPSLCRGSATTTIAQHLYGARTFIHAKLTLARFDILKESVKVQSSHFLVCLYLKEGCIATLLLNSTKEILPVYLFRHS